MLLCLLAVAVTPCVAAAEPDAGGPAAAGSARAWRGLVGASAIGSTYDWLSFDRGEILFQSRPDGVRSNTVMSEFSPGPGFSISLGGVGRRVIGPVSFAGAVEYLQVYHSTSFDGGGALANSEASASLRVVRFQLRAIWDACPLKPFVGSAPGLSRLSLPEQELRWSSTSPQLVIVDAWTSGISVATLLGVLYEIRPQLLINTSIGHRIEIFDRTNEVEFDSVSMAADGFTFALGIEWWP